MDISQASEANDDLRGSDFEGQPRLQAILDEIMLQLASSKRRQTRPRHLASGEHVRKFEISTSEYLAALFRGFKTQTDINTVLIEKVEKLEKEFAVKKVEKLEKEFAVKKVEKLEKEFAVKINKLEKEVAKLNFALHELEKFKSARFR